MNDTPANYTLAKNMQRVLANMIKSPYWNTTSDSLVSSTRTATIPDPIDDPRVKALMEKVQAYSDATDAWAKLNSASNLRSAGQCRIAMFAALSTITKEPPHE